MKKISILLMSILLAFNSCSDEELVNSSSFEESSINGHNQKLNKRTLTFEDFYKLNNSIEVKNVAEKISKINLASKLNKSENYNVSTENIIEIEYFNQKTYTFFVKNDKDGLLNFVIKETPEKTSYYLILYPNNFTPYKKEEINTKVKIKEISQSELVYISFDNTISSKSASEIYGNACAQIMSCSSGQHNKDNISEWYKCIASSKPQTIIVDCDNDLPIGGGGGGTGSGGGPIGGDPSNPNPGNGQQPPTGVITDPNTGQDYTKLIIMLNEITVYLQNRITQPQLDFLYANIPILTKINSSIKNAEYSQETYLWLIGYLINNTSARDYFNQNPSSSWDYLENWFMTPREGKDYAYDASYWENPNLTFQQQNLPTWSNFNNAYRKYSNPDDRMLLVNEIGGAVKQAFIDYPQLVRGFCAVTLSHALNYSGVTIPNIPTTGSALGTIQGGDGKYYFLNAKALNKWMRKTFGTNPVNSKHLYIEGSEGGINGENFPNLINSNVKGIYSLVSYNSQWASGHADLIQNRLCPYGCHFNDNPPAPIEYIDIWILD